MSAHSQFILGSTTLFSRFCGFPNGGEVLYQEFRDFTPQNSSSRRLSRSTTYIHAFSRLLCVQFYLCLSCKLAQYTSVATWAGLVISSFFDTCVSRTGILGIDSYFVLFACGPGDHWRCASLYASFSFRELQCWLQGALLPQCSSFLQTFVW